jgi:hypothetical protein
LCRENYKFYSWFRKTLAMNKETGKYLFAARAAAGSCFSDKKDTKIYRLAAHAAAGSCVAFTKIQKVFSLPLMPRQAVTFASCGESNQKRLLLRRQNLSAQVTAQPQPSRSKQRQTRQRSNSGAVLPRCGATARHTPQAL